MTLQLRLQHALGSRLIEVEERGVDNPLRIGRSSECDVTLPSAGIGAVHCMVYCHEGQWVIFDGGDPHGTALNGQRLTEPAYLFRGDVITIGRDAARIEVDPPGNLPMRPASINRPATAAVAASNIAPLQPIEQVPTEVASDDGPAEEGWPGPVIEYATPRRRPKSSSTAAIIVCVAAAIIALGLGLSVFRQSTVSIPTARPAPPPAPAASTRASRTGIFDFERETASTRPAAVILPARGTPPVPAEPIDPLKQTDEWKRVEQAASPAERASRTLWVVSDYRRRYPGQLDADLARIEEEALDRLWWRRIQNLTQQRDALDVELRNLNRQINEETSVDLKRKLEADHLRQSELRTAVIEILKQDMGYSEPTAPNLYDDAELAALRQKRDPARYLRWKKSVLSSIERTRELPFTER